MTGVGIHLHVVVHVSRREGPLQPSAAAWFDGVAQRRLRASQADLVS